MRITYELTSKDIEKFNLFHIYNSPKMKRTIMWQRSIMPLVFLFVAFSLSRTAEIHAFYLYALGIIAALLWFMYYPKYFKNIIRRQVSKAVQGDKVKTETGHHELMMTERNYTYAKPGALKTETWKKVERFEEDEEMFYIYNTSFSAIIVPKRAVEDPTEVRAFINERLKLN